MSEPWTRPWTVQVVLECQESLRWIPTGQHVELLQFGRSTVDASVDVHQSRIHWLLPCDATTVSPLHEDTNDAQLELAIHIQIHII